MKLKTMAGRIVARKIQMRRGLKRDLPELAEAEIGITRDTREMYFGSTRGNRRVLTDSDLSDRLGKNEKAVDSAKLDGNNLDQVRNGVTKSQVGLSNVDNVRQASKAEFDSHVDNKGNPHNVTSRQVNLINLMNAEEPPSSYPDGVSLFYVNNANINSWRDMMPINLGTNNRAIVETFSGGLNGFTQRITFFSSLINSRGDVVYTAQRNAFQSSFDWGEWSQLITGNEVMQGSGNPEGVVTASKGTLYLRTDGGTDTTLYVKTSGSGNAGWTAK